MRVVGLLIGVAFGVKMDSSALRDVVPHADDVAQLFDSFDHDSNGAAFMRDVLDFFLRYTDPEKADAVTSALMSMNGGRHLASDVVNSRVFRRMWKAALDAAGSIDIREDENGKHHYATLIRDTWGFATKDEHGTASVEEISEMIQQYLATPEEVARLPNFASEGRLSYDQFKNYMYNKKVPTEESVQQIFLTFDRNEQGTASIEEIRESLLQTELATAEQVRGLPMFASEGRLSYDQFKEFMYNKDGPSEEFVVKNMFLTFDRTPDGFACLRDVRHFFTSRPVDCPEVDPAPILAAMEDAIGGPMTEDLQVDLALFERLWKAVSEKSESIPIVTSKKGLMHWAVTIRNFWRFVDNKDPSGNASVADVTEMLRYMKKGSPESLETVLPTYAGPDGQMSYSQFKEFMYNN